MKIYRASLALAVFAVCATLGCHHKDEPHSVTLNWQSPTGAEAASYRVYRRTPESGFVKLADVPAPPYEDHLVLSGHTYFYAVTAIDKSGHESRFSVPAETTIP